MILKTLFYLLKIHGLTFQKANSRKKRFISCSLTFVLGRQKLLKST